MKRTPARSIPLAGLPVLATLAVLLTTAAPPAAAADKATTTSPAVTRSAHIAYEGCPAKDVVLSVSVGHDTYLTGQLVTYRVSLHNESGRRCTVPGDQASILLPNANSSSPAGGQLGYLLGPCSSLPLTIDNSKGVQVFPGPEAVSCPNFLGPPLGAHATISTTGTWNQMVGGGLRPARVPTLAPPGRYRIMVGSKVGVSVTFVGPQAAPGVTSAGRPVGP